MAGKTTPKNLMIEFVCKIKLEIFKQKDNMIENKERKSSKI